MKQKRNYETATLDAILLSSRAQLLSESEPEGPTSYVGNSRLMAMGSVGSLE